MKLLNKTEIEAILPSLDPLPLIEAGFVEYSAKKCNIPPVGELIMEKGEVHIKYGCVNGEDYYVIKIASGFYDNPKIGLSSSNGLMLVFSQNTGEVIAVLHDECLLTDIRTAIAGAIAAKHMAPKNVNTIGIVGTGVQARMQLEYLKGIIDCNKVVVWGRSPEKLVEYRDEMRAKGFDVSVTTDMAELCAVSNLIITTTPAYEPLITMDMVKPGTHITAMGSDTPEKQELDADILANADIVVADSISQCQIRGEICQALKQGKITNDDILELGNVIANGGGRDNDEQITVADLTGVAVQDVKIAEAVYLASLVK